MLNKIMYVYILRHFNCNIEMMLNSFELCFYNLICLANFHRNLSHKTYYAPGFRLILFSCFFFLLLCVGPLQQYYQNNNRGYGGSVWWYPVPPHQLI